MAEEVGEEAGGEEEKEEVVIRSRFGDFALVLDVGERPVRYLTSPTKCNVIKK